MGHKYIKKYQLPSGKYRYVYADPSTHGKIGKMKFDRYKLYRDYKDSNTIMYGPNGRKTKIYQTAEIAKRKGRDQRKHNIIKTASDIQYTHTINSNSVSASIKKSIKKSLNNPIGNVSSKISKGKKKVKKIINTIKNTPIVTNKSTTTRSSVSSKFVPITELTLK